MASQLDELLAEADPRVHWALRALDNEGVEPTSIVGYYLPVVANTVLGALMVPLGNLAARKPMYSHLPMAALVTALGFGFGLKVRQWTAANNARQMRMTQHYIMTHPDKFAEVERKKFGDRVVFLPWAKARS